MFQNPIVPKKPQQDPKIEATESPVVRVYDKNAKKHPDHQLKLIADSLRRFGWQQPIKVGAGGVIIAGHGRWMAFKKYPDGIKNAWIIDAEGDTISGGPETRRLTTQEEKEYRLVDNKLNESEWAFDNLKIELDESPSDFLQDVFSDSSVSQGTEGEEKEDKKEEIKQNSEAKMQEFECPACHHVFTKT